MGLGDYVGLPVRGATGLYNKVRGIPDQMAGGGETEISYDEKKIDPQREQEQASREYQDWLTQQYRDSVEGKSPSIAEQRMIAQNASAKRQQIAMARSGGGGALGQAGAMRTAQQMTAQQDADLARSTGLLRAEERASMMSGMAGMTGQLRGADQARMAAEMDYSARQAEAKAAMEEAYKSRRSGSNAGLVAAGGTILGGYLATQSDERIKESVSAVPPDQIEAFLEAAAGHRYQYRDGYDEDPGRERVGVMAQDLERTEVGRSFVNEGDDGTKYIDTAKGYGAMLAAMHEMHARIKALESGGK